MYQELILQLLDAVDEDDFDNLLIEFINNMIEQKQTRKEQDDE